jgi:hypothetical protein
VLEEEDGPQDEKAQAWADRGWWLAVEYGVVAKQARFEKKLERLRELGTMKELLEPGGRIVYRNLFREDQVRQAWTLLAEMTPWKSQLHWYLNGEERSEKEVHDILWCAGFLKGERPCRGVVPEGKGSDRKAHAWAIGCDRMLSVAPHAFDEATEEKRHVLTFGKVDEKGVMVFDRAAIAEYLAAGKLNKWCPLSPARDPSALAAVFQDVSVRAFGWPLALEMTPSLKKKLGASVLEAEHGFVLRKGQGDFEEYGAVELRWPPGAQEPEVRRAAELRGGTIAQKVRVSRKVETVLQEGVRLRGVRIEEGYVKMPELGGRYEVEQRFVLATRFHLGLQDDAAKYEGYEVGTVPKATPEYEKWAKTVLDSVP